MAHKKGQGSTKNVRDSNPKYLGTKLFDGEGARSGSIIVRQRGSKILAGCNTKMGKDHTIFSLRDGTVKFTIRRKSGFNGVTKIFKVANVV